MGIYGNADVAIYSMPTSGPTALEIAKRERRWLGKLPDAPVVSSGLVLMLKILWISGTTLQFFFLASSLSNFVSGLSVYELGNRLRQRGAGVSGIGVAVYFQFFLKSALHNGHRVKY